MDDGKEKRKKVLCEIQSLSDSIRKKHRAIKRGIAETASTLENTFRPLVDPLKTLTKQLGAKVENEKRFSSNQPDDDAYVDRIDDFKPVTTPVHHMSLSDEAASTSRFQSPVSNTTNLLQDSPLSTLRFQRTYTLAETPGPPEVDYLCTPEGRQESITMLENEPHGLLAKEYLTRFLRDTENKIDHTYGPRLVNNTVMVGDGSLEFENNDLYVKGKRYPGTRGLYELLFMRQPAKGSYTRDDQSAYRSILIATNAHRQKYNPNKQINSNSGCKYRNIIRLLFTRGGKLISDKKFIMRQSTSANSPIEYVYWNDVNELTDRLKLLISSRDAGHTGHNNEIVSIIEELKEARVIV